MEKYVAPAHHKTAFHCPFCKVYARQEWNGNWINTQHSAFSHDTNRFALAGCVHCGRLTLWCKHNQDEPFLLLYPVKSTAPDAHEDMPQELQSLYEEAQLVFPLSPRASAALLRLLLQKFMPHCGQDELKPINESIGKLVSQGLPQEISNALDVCRVIGNHAVHPGTINIDENPSIVSNLFGVVNFMVDELIAKPKRIAALYATLPDGEREKIEKRNAKAASAVST